MNDSWASGSGGGPPRSSVGGEVQPFDPGPSVAAAAAVLEAHGADFALIGGLALEAWGIHRNGEEPD